MSAKNVMGTGRLEAFSDGVIAIILTIMVLELKVPHGADLAALLPLCSVFVSYVLSFVYVGIYWVSEALYVTVALVWLIPDRRIESVLPRGEAG